MTIGSTRYSREFRTFAHRSAPSNSNQWSVQLVIPRFTPGRLRCRRSRPRNVSISSQVHSNQYQFALDSAGDFRRTSTHQHVDFAAQTEFRKVNPRLDRETGIRKQFPLVVGFEVIHIGAVAVDLLANGMSDAIIQVFRVPGSVQYVACRLVHLPAGEVLPQCDRTRNFLYPCVPRADDDVENFANTIRN